MLASWAELLYSNRADFTAVASTASEASLLAGPNLQPVLPPLYLDGNKNYGKVLSLWGRGVFGTTGTPTMTFQFRLGSTQGSTDLTGASLGVTSAITTQSGVTNKFWEFHLDIIVGTPGQGTNNTTLICGGSIQSMSGFASPFSYPIEPTAPDTATWTQTTNSVLQLYFNFSLTWSASSGSNTCTLKQLFLAGWN